MIPDAPPLTQRAILRLYWPLAMSWLFMALELPISVAIVSRLPDPKINTAALLILSAIAIWIESPVIDLLATSTTLAKGRNDVATIQRFALLIIVGVTAVHALVVLTPLYGLLVEGVLRIPPEVADAARKGLALMVPWSALIGWRRYLQGIMIRNGRTRPIGIGTLLRVSTLSLVGFGLFFFSKWPSIEIVATGLMCSVAAEAIFMHVASRRTLRECYPPTDSGASISPGQLARFHFPLSISSMVTLSSMPLIGAALARAPDAILAMDCWQVASAVLFLPRSVTYALLEVVISLSGRVSDSAVLRLFCAKVGLLASGFIIVAALSGLDMILFRRVIGADAEISELAHIAFFASALVPATNAAMSYLRGELTARHMTVARLSAISIGLGVMVAALVVGVWMRWSGAIIAAVALTLSQFGEWASLALAYGRRMRGGEVRS